MKIIHTESSCGWGGQELRVLDEAAGLAARGHELLLVVPPEARIFEEAKRRGLRVLALPIRRKTLGGVLALRKLLKSECPQVVNTHSSTDSWLTALACVLLRGRPSIVRTRHISAPIPGDWGSKWLYSRAASRIITTGEALRRQVIEQTGAAPWRVISVPTGVDLDRFSPGDRLSARSQLGLAADGFIVGIVATLRSWKGHRYLLDAVASMDDSSVRVVIVGGGPGEQNLRRQADELGLSNRIIFAGQRDDVVQWLHAFDVFALPSYANEGVPQAIMQAMACGLPVITTSVGAIGEIARDGETALIVSPRDRPSLAAAIRRLKNDAGLRASLATAGLSQARSRLKRDGMLDAMERVFFELANGTG